MMTILCLMIVMLIIMIISQVVFLFNFCQEHERKIVEKSQAFIAAHGNLNHTRTKTEKEDQGKKFHKQCETSWEDKGIGEEKDQEFDY